MTGFKQTLKVLPNFLAVDTLPCQILHRILGPAIELLVDIGVKNPQTLLIEVRIQADCSTVVA
jgi:hypothetical protein